MSAASSMAFWTRFASSSICLICSGDISIELRSTFRISADSDADAIASRISRVGAPVLSNAVTRSRPTASATAVIWSADSPDSILSALTLAIAAS